MIESKNIRLNKIAREFNVGIPFIVRILASKGIRVDSNPNTRITSEHYAMLAEEIRGRQIEEAADKPSVREIDFAELDAYSRRQSYHRRLRPYQQEHKTAIYKAWGEGKIGIMLQMPTGTGKTHLFSSIIKDLQDYFYDKGSDSSKKNIEERLKWSIPKILVLVHRKELLEQIEDTLTCKYNHVCGTLGSGKEFGTSRNVIVASVQTLSRKTRLTKWEQDTNFDFIIIDEAHHSPADSYQRIRQTWPNARLLGVTATPYRLNHQPFTDSYDHLILSQPVFKFIEQGYLCNYEYYSIRPDSRMQYQIDHLKTDFSGDFDEQDMERLLNQDRIRAGILDTYERFAKGKKGIVYTINRQHNQMLAALFKQHGYRVAYIDSQTPKEERAHTVDVFRRGKIDIIFNVNIFSEGFDCPDVEFIQLARPTKSLAMYLQQVGRGFRICDGKEKVLFLDNVGLYNRFGLPSARRHWKHHFEGQEDWEESVSGKRDPMEEHKYHPRDLSEGNEDIMLVYPSANNEEEKEKTIKSENNDMTQETESKNMDNEIVIQHNSVSYHVNDTDQNKLADLLCLIEEVRHTGWIDLEAIRKHIEQTVTSVKMQKIMSVLSANGFSGEVALALLQENEEARTKMAAGTSLRDGIYVRLRNGQIIQGRSDAATMVEAIKQAGIERVYNLHIPILKTFLVSTELHPNPRYHTGQHNIGKYYVITYMDTARKCSKLEQISKRLGLAWTVGVKERVGTQVGQHDRQAEDNVQNTSRSKGLYVVTHDGKIIQDTKDAKTFHDAIEEAGVERVYDMHIKRLGSDLIMKTAEVKNLNPIYLNRLHPIGNDEYRIIINFSNREKQRILEHISTCLGLGWNVGIGK